MVRFVEWLAARRYRLILLAAALAMLPLLAILGQAVIVFTVLVRGLREGLLVAAAATALIVLPSFLQGAEPLPVIILALVNWLPALGLAVVLERSRSLSLTVQVATVVVALGVTAFFMFGTPTESWRVWLVENFSGQFATVSEDLLTELSRVMTGLVGGMTLLVSMAAVFIGRWWQSLLQRPGAFGTEFRALRLGFTVGLIAALVFLAAGLTRVTLLENLTLVLLCGFMLHGLAVLHAYVVSAGNSGLWLTATYGLMIFAMPFAEIAVAALGFLDNWFNFRSRFADREIS